MRIRFHSILLWLWRATFASLTELQVPPRRQKPILIKKQPTARIPCNKEHPGYEEIIGSGGEGGRGGAGRGEHPGLALWSSGEQSQAQARDPNRQHSRRHYEELSLSL
ncbi:hypothetical protein RRG08_057015 [Elysia crispata]|uniref:Secreted protein n=1 Tax=Elysia crispata TaxID=231223 RepID=A0AAE1DAS1_9GAST|nr:hypothetical protein RRG08_057015 [Elysia crispata]